MRLTNLTKAHTYEVEKYLKEKLDLTDYQYSRMKQDEFVRFSKYEFYKWDKESQPNILWRMSIVLYLLFVLFLYLFLPFTFILRGEWGYGQKFYDNVYAKWRRKLRI